MNERQQLEADLDRAKGYLAKAASDLAKATAIFTSPDAGLHNAKSNLRKMVTALAKSKADPAKARANLEKARTDCRRATSALGEFDRAHATQQSTHSSEHLVRDVGKREANVSHGKKVTGSLARLRDKNLLVPGDAHDRALLVKHTVMLLAIVLAFLQYYLLDTQLQIARLSLQTSAQFRLVGGSNSV